MLINPTAPVIDLLQQIDPYSACSSPSWGHEVAPLLQGGWGLRFTEAGIAIIDRDDQVVSSAKIGDIPVDLLPAMSYLADLAVSGELSYIEELTGCGLLCVFLEGAGNLRKAAAAAIPSRQAA